MCSTRNALLVLCLACGLFTGCMSMTEAPREPAGVQPMGVSTLPPDEAMPYRDWDRTAVMYPSGDVVAGPVGFGYRTRDDLPDWQHLMLDPALFVVQSAALPVTWLLSDSPQVYWGADVETACEAVPPVEGDIWN